MTGGAKAPLLRKEREEMDTKTKEALLGLARKTARAIRNRTRIPGWHENEERFPESDFTDILGMLEKAYELGKTEVAKDADLKGKALGELLHDLCDWMDCGFISEKTYFEEVTGCVPMELLDEFGYGQRIRQMDKDGVLEDEE